jgi:hypothetical protein
LILAYFDPEMNHAFLRLAIADRMVACNEGHKLSSLWLEALHKNQLPADTLPIPIILLFHPLSTSFIIDMACVSQPSDRFGCCRLAVTTHLKNRSPMEQQLYLLKKIKRLQIFYVATIGALMLMIVGTPVLVRRWIAITNYLLRDQEVLETLLIAVLLSLAYALSHIYNKLLNAHREEIQHLAMKNDGLQGRLTDAYKYIGKVNVQLQEIHSAFSLLNRLPQSRKDLKNLLSMFAQKALTIANTDWVAVRIIDRPSLRTVIEHLETRTEATFSLPHIGNKYVVEEKSIVGQVVVRCENKALDFTVVCIFPRNELSWEEKILLESIAGEIELLFLTYTAIHSRKVDQSTQTLARLYRSLPRDGS